MGTRLLMFMAPILAIAAAASQTAVVESVSIRNSEIYATYVGADEPKRLTDDTLEKGLASISFDGKRIAYIGADFESLGHLVILAADGAKLLDVAIRPKIAHVPGMRYIERLNWVTNDRVVIAGSLNPSTCEFVILDIRTGEEVDGQFVDGWAWAASPDGSHVAYLGRVPHFLPREERRPRLCLDDECGIDGPDTGYPDDDRHVEFDGGPLWSPDGTQVAIVARDYKSNALSVIVRTSHRNSREYATPRAAGAHVQISWEQSTLIVKGESGVWHGMPQSQHLIRVGK